MSVPDIFQTCLNHARHVDSDKLMRVRVHGSHGAILLTDMARLQRIPSLMHILTSGGLLAVRPDEIEIAPHARNAHDISRALITIGEHLKSYGIIAPGAAWNERCRLTDNWDWETSRAKTAIYSRALRGFFGFAYFGTILVPYARNANGDLSVVLATSLKKDAAGKPLNIFDLIGGNVSEGWLANNSMAKEAAEETGGGLVLKDSLYAPAYGRRAAPLVHALRTSKVEANKVLNGYRRVYKLQIPEGAEKSWQPQKSELAGFQSVPLRTLLNAWESGDPKSPYAIKNFKHNVPVCILALAADQGVIKPTLQFEKALESNFVFPATGTLPARQPRSIKALLPDIPAAYQRLRALAGRYLGYVP